MSSFYVICPVQSDEEFGRKRAILENLGRSCSLIPLFPLDRKTSSDTRSLIEEMREALFILVDLSLERPSCYFELGLAEVSGAPLLLLAKDGSTIHQIGLMRNVEFFTDLDRYKTIVSRFITQLRGENG